MTIHSYLEKFDLTDIFSKELINQMVLQKVRKGENLVRIGEPLEHFFLLVEGKLKVFTFQENGKKILIRFYRPLSAVGDLEYLSGYTPNAVVEAPEESLVIAIPMKTIRSYTLECPRFLRFIITQLSQKLYSYSKLSSLNLVYPLINRVASYLWSLSQIDNSKQLEEIRVSSLEEMSDLLCTSYRHLSRVLLRMEDSGIIIRSRGKIRISDFEKLDKLAVGMFE